MSILHCPECGAMIDTDIEPDAWRAEFHDELMCEACYAQALDHRDAIIQAAKDMYEDDDVNIWEGADVKEVENGAWVQGWVWVPDND